MSKILIMHKTLADRTRYAIFDAILKHPNISGKGILAEFHISQPTLSFHLNKLEQSGLIKVTKEGQTHYYSANIQMIEEMVEYANKIIQANKKV